MSEIKLQGLDETEKLIAALAGILNALTSRAVIISTTAGGIMVRDAEGKRIGKVVTEFEEWVVS